MPSLDGHAIGRIKIPGSQIGRLTRIEVCSAIATLTVIAATALIVCLH
jgi:hypothetical protein